MATIDELTRARKAALNKWGQVQNQTNDKKVISDAKAAADAAGRALTAAQDEERRKKPGGGSSVLQLLRGK